MRRQLLEKLAEDDYRAGAKSLEVMGNHISPARAGRILRQEGERLHGELFGPEAILKAGQAVVSNPARLMILTGDGSRYRTNEADQKHGEKGAVQGAGSGAAAVAAEGETDRGWRENKIGLVIRAQPGGYQPDGSYAPPTEQVKTYVATTADVYAFGRDLHTEAKRRGLDQSEEVVWVSDHGHGMTELRAREFDEANMVTDFYHAAGRLEECARILKGEGPAFQRERQRCFHGLRSWLWEGKADRVIAALQSEASRLSPRPKHLAELAARPEAWTLWTHALYFEKHSATMDYPAYRAKGWPMGSGTVESACGQFGDRFKHNRMRWTRKGADAGHQVKAAILSQDDRWANRWPQPIPTLDLPAAS